MKIQKLEQTEHSGVINLMIRPVGLALSLLYTPLLLNYLGDEKYGLWATVLSIISWVNYFDVGIGNGLRNLIPELYLKKDFTNLKKTISTAYLLVMSIASGLFIILLLILSIINWNSVFGTQIDMVPVIGISFTFICVNFVLSLCDTILYSLQYPVRVSLKGIFAQVINIVGILILTKWSESELVFVAILFGASQFVANVANSYYLMKDKLYLRPSIKQFDKKYIGKICSTGIKFFIIQIMCLVMFTTDKLIVTHFWGGAANTQFSIVDSVFNTGFSVFAAFMVPYWSRATVAYVEHDSKWIKDSIKKASGVLMLFIAGYICMIFLFRPIVNLWIGRDLGYSRMIIVVMAMFYTLYSILHVECQFINGTGEIGVQLILYIICGILNIPLSIFLGKYIGLGAEGVRLATTSLVLIIVIVLGFDLKRIIKKIN